VPRRWSRVQDLLWLAINAIDARGHHIRVAEQVDQVESLSGSGKAAAARTSSRRMVRSMTSATTMVSRPTAASPPVMRAVPTRVDALPSAYAPKEHATAHITLAAVLAVRKREQRIAFSPAKTLRRSAVW